MFHFKHFSLNHEKSTLKIGTDSVLLAAAVPVCNVNSVLDIGTGCGVIIYCLADKMRQQITDKQVFTGIDIDYNSITEATENIQLFAPAAHQSFAFYHSSLQTFTPHDPASFDLIVSNPPYFANSLKPTNEQRLISKHCDNVLSFDELIHHAARLLSPTGSFYTILPTTAITPFLSHIPSDWRLVYQLDIAPKISKPDHRVILGFSKDKTVETKVEHLIIRDEQNQYTDAYKAITRNFYLSLK